MNFSRLLLKSLLFNARRFESATKDPMRAQEKVLFKYLAHNKETEYAKAYDFSRIRSVEEYQKSVPLNDCGTLRPYIDRMKEGERNILTADDVIFFGLTSGTTSKPKFIPVTRYSCDRKAEVANLWAYYISRDHPKVLDGKILAIISPEIEGYAKSGVPYGAESGHGYKHLPEIIRRYYAVPYDVFNIADYESRYYAILRLSIGQNITTLATLNPSMFILLFQKLAKWQDRIICDIEMGTLSKELSVPPEVRRIIEKDLKPDPKRADELRKIVADHGALLPKYFWSHLELIECWKGGTVKIYLKELPQYFGDVRVRDFGCLSTEARSSIPMSDVGAGGVLAIETNFYEFIPKEDIGKKDKRFLLCDQVEVGKEYFLVVTTPGGLYRYNIDDIIRVNGFFNKTPVIEFIQKGLNAVSLTGEKIYESQINDALTCAADKHKIGLMFFTACAELRTPARYIFLTEFIGDPSFEIKKLFLQSVEKELYKQNNEYSDLRKQQLLAPPVLKVARHGEFEKYRFKKISEGTHDTQFKIPELTVDPSFQTHFSISEVIELG